MVVVYYLDKVKANIVIKKDFTPMLSYLYSIIKGEKG